MPVEILSGLHRMAYHSPALNRYPAVAEVLRTNPPPTPGRTARDPLFSGTIHFAQVTFATPGGDLVVPTADMNQIVQYAQHAVVPISDYAEQYGSNAVTVSPALLTKTVSLSGTSFSDNDLQGWVNDLASSNSLFVDHCIFVPVPPGVSAANLEENAGYHSKANIPYIAAGVSIGLTLADNADVYAMAVSHEAAEMVVDPNVDGNNPEVCDPCDINCNNLTRCYFDSSDNFLGTNQASPPGGFPFTYYTCAVVQPTAAADCPAPSANCQYSPPPVLTWQLVDNTAVFGNLADGQHLVWTGDFTGTGHSEVLFYYSGDGNWWLRDFNAATWHLVDNTAGFGNLADGQHPVWIGDFTGAGHSQVLFYYSGDGNWWLRSM